MLQFSILVKLPSGRSIRVAELPNKLYLNLIKYSENRDLEGLNRFFIELLNIPYDLDIIDRLYLLIYYRMVFISDNIIFTNKENKSLEFSIDLILEKLEKYNQDYSCVIEDKDIKISLGLPTVIYFDESYNIFNSVIRTIHIKDTFIDFNKLSIKERDNILTLLPSRIANKINNYIDSIRRDVGDIILIDSKEEFDIQQYSVDILSNRTMLFVCSLYSHNLIDYFETLYGYVTKISADSEFYKNLSPVETRIILNIHNKAVEKENKELKKQQH